MRKTLSILIPGVLALLPAIGFAAGQRQGGLPLALTFTFKDIGGVTSWKAGGDTVVFVKNRADQWYRVDMAETCMALDTKKGINFIVETDPETKARTNAVVVDRHICKVTSLKPVPATDVPTAK